jgi:hypothetical protein
MQTFGDPQTGVWLGKIELFLICVKQVTLAGSVRGYIRQS